MDHVYGGLPPDAVTVAEYGMPIDPFGSAACTDPFATNTGYVITRGWATAASVQQSAAKVSQNSEGQDVFCLEISARCDALFPGIPILHPRVLFV